MITYEVNLDIDASLRADYIAWLQTHVEEMLHFDGFASVVIEQVVEPSPAPGRFALCLRYRVRDAACLDDYLSRHAPRMREEGLSRFGDGVHAHRRVLRPHATS